MERTFAIIKPDAVAATKAGRILARIEKEGFTVRAMRLMHLTKGEAEGFYAVHTRAAVLRRADRLHVVGPVHRDGARGAGRDRASGAR